jgi:PleD family two-component response regulator
VRRTVQAIRGQTRGSDTIGVWHERIAVLLPHTTLEGALAAGERLRAAVAREPVRAGAADLRVTASAGLAAFQERGTIFFDSVLKAAEGALAEALTRGGDRLCVAGPPAPPSA